MPTVLSQHSNHFKEMWNYFGKIKWAKNRKGTGNSQCLVASPNLRWCGLYSTYINVPASRLVYSLCFNNTVFENSRNKTPNIFKLRTIVPDIIAKRLHFKYLHLDRLRFRGKSNWSIETSKSRNWVVLAFQFYSFSELFWTHSRYFAFHMSFRISSLFTKNSLTGFCNYVNLGRTQYSGIGSSNPGMGAMVTYRKGRERIFVRVSITPKAQLHDLISRVMNPCCELAKNYPNCLSPRTKRVDGSMPAVRALLPGRRLPFSRAGGRQPVGRP